MTREEIIEISNNYKNGDDRNKLKEWFSDMNNVRTNRRTIVFSTPSETGTSFFRILEPLLAIYRATDDYNLIYTEKITPFMIEVADLIVMHRAGNDHDQIHTLFKHYQRDKVRPIVVHNVDDNEFNLPASHPMKDMWIAMGKDKMAIRSISESDHIETTTRKLASTFKGYNNHVHIRRNRFNWNLPQWNLDDTEKKERFGDKLVIGWCGLTSHFNDLIKMKPILKNIQEKYPNVHILLAGMAISDKKYEVKRDPNTGQKYVEESEIENKAETYRARVAQLYSDLDQDRLTLEDAVGLEEYGKFYSWMDIGISYIEHNGFNACKCLVGDTKVLKYDNSDNHHWVNIEDIYKSFNMQEINFVLDSRGYEKKVINAIKYENRECLKIITENGYIIEGTLNHRIKNEFGQWFRFDELQVGDIIQLAGKMDNIKNNITPFFLNTILHMLKSDKVASIKDHFSFIGVSGQMDHLKSLQLEFLKIGEITSFYNGFLSIDYSSIKKLINVLPEHKINTFFVDLNFPDIKMDNGKSIHQIEFDSSAWKYSKTDTKYSLDKIKRIEISYNDVYDIEVDSQEHEYVANGFVSHNSEIKSCEYAVYGSIPVYSKYGGYFDFHELMIENKALEGIEGAEEYYNNMAINSEREQEWADKLCYWVDMWNNDREQYDLVSGKVKEFVSSYYSIDEHIHEQISFYSKLIEENLERNHERITRHYNKYAEMEID